jgi:hypothetical protein
MTHEQKKTVQQFVTRVHKMRKLQSESQASKQAGDHNVALTKWNESYHYARLVDETLTEVTDIISSRDQLILDL